MPSQICVSLGRTRHKMMIAEHQAMAQKGAGLVEMRLDFIAHAPDLSRLFKDRPTPIIATCRRDSDKGLWKGTEEQRQTLLKAAILAGIEYVDLEEDTARIVRRYGKTKRIVSYHNFEETPANIEEIHERLSKCDADIIKLATMANNPQDNVRMLKLVAASKIPTTGFCMGDLGVISRILAGRYGAPFTYATVSRERVIAPGQLTFRELHKLYRYEQIDQNTILHGVLGDPVGHSLSPLLHNTAFAMKGMNRAYLPLRVPRDVLQATLNDFEWLGFQGYSVTIPHKEAMLERKTKKLEGVLEIGAANTLFKDAAGEWTLANSDYSAAIESLLVGLTAQHGQETSLSGKRVLILGAGGVAKAIARGVQAHGAALTITNRSRDRGAELAEKLGCQFIGWENRGAQFADILVNCTSVGMHPNMNESPMAENWLREGMLVFDTVYTPENTLLIKQARERRCEVVTGVEMFVRQAARQFVLFTGVEAPLEELRATLRRAISAIGQGMDD